MQSDALKKPIWWGAQGVEGDTEGGKETGDCPMGTERGGCQEVGLSAHRAGVSASLLTPGP